MSDLAIDFDELGAAAGRVERLRMVVLEAGSVASDTAELTGHAGLASRVLEFADVWATSRGELERGLASIAEALRAILETFAHVDTRLGAAAASPVGATVPIGIGR